MDEFIAKLKAAFKHYSTYVVFIATATATYWLQLDKETQMSIMESYPLLKLVGPGIGLMAFLIAKGMPQPPKE